MKKASLTARSLAVFGRAKSRIIGILFDEGGVRESWYWIAGVSGLVLICLSLLAETMYHRRGAGGGEEGEFPAPLCTISRGH
jgi:hypothetical protein